MSDVLQLILALTIIISAAKLAGLASTRLGQPAVLGELLAGVVLGPTLLNFLRAPFMTSAHLEPTIMELAELGVIFLMFIAGLEIEIDELRRSGRIAIFTGTLGVVTPLLLGFAAAIPFGYDLRRALFIGVLLTATSVSISAQTLLELGRLRTRVGVTLLGAAVLDDVLVILILSLFLAIADGGGIITVLATVARMVLFLAGAALLGSQVIPPLVNRVSRWPISQPVLTIAILVTLLLSWAAELVGEVAAITGAFLAGVLFARTAQHAQIARGIQGLAYAFFVPIFFVSIGLRTNALLLSNRLLLFAVIICIVAIISKIIGCWLGARLGGVSNREALQIGMGMVSRGEVGLIVAAVGITAGIITEEVFAVIVVMVLVTTLVTPLLLRLVFREPRASKAAQEAPEQPAPTASE